jgi:hypothetical protein
MIYLHMAEHGEWVGPPEFNERLSEEVRVVYESVDKRYDSSELALNPERLTKYKEHFREVTEMAVEYAERIELPEGEVALLAVAAGLHDLTKGDTPPPDIPDSVKHIYWLVAHGETAAAEVGQYLDANPSVQDFLKTANPGLGDFAIKERIEMAIRSHMGPNPGFMEGVLNYVNGELGEDSRISHPYPEEGDRVAEILLAADMKSLAGPQGVEKVIGDIMADKKEGGWREEAQLEAEKANELGYDFTTAQMAFLSAYDSGVNAFTMIKNDEDKEWVGEALDETENHIFVIEGEKVDAREVIERWNKYNAEAGEVKPAEAA